MESQGLPCTIGERHGFYSVNTGGDFSFRVPYERQPVDKIRLQFEKLATLFANHQKFTNKEARISLDLSTAAMQELLNWGLKCGRIKRMGNTKRTTEYKITPSPQTKEICAPPAISKRAA